MQIRLGDPRAQIDLKVTQPDDNRVARPACSCSNFGVVQPSLRRTDPPVLCKDLVIRTTTPPTNFSSPHSRENPKIQRNLRLWMRTSVPLESAYPALVVRCFTTQHIHGSEVHLADLSVIPTTLFSLPNIRFYVWRRTLKRTGIFAARHRRCISVIA